MRRSCEGCEYEVVPSNEQFFSTDALHLRGEVHSCHYGSNRCTFGRAAVVKTRAVLCARLARKREPPMSGLTSHCAHYLHLSNFSMDDGRAGYVETS